MKKTYGCLVILLVLLLSWQTGFAAPFSSRDFFRKGVAYENQKAYGEAIDMFTEAIRLDPTYADAYLHRGKAYRIYEISATREAIDDFSSAIALLPKNAEAYYERGLVNAFVINNEAAKSDMITAAGLGHEDARQWLMALNDRKVDAPPPVVAPKAEPTGQQQGFELADYLPGGVRPIVYFDFDRAVIKPEGFPVLDEIGGVLRQRLPTAVILVVGHTDNIGTKGYNAELSLRRAEAVRDYLTVKHGIDAARILAEGYGEMAPEDTNETESGRARNRRAVLAGIHE
jgi:outer membrane protein OmpA-like peptidoglycan-associated protein